MKRVVLLSAFLLVGSITSFAQSKAETIQWIKDKINQYGSQDLYMHIPEAISSHQLFVEVRKAHDSDSIIVSASYCIQWLKDDPSQCYQRKLSQIHLDNVTNVKLNASSDNGKSAWLSIYGTNLFNAYNGCFCLSINWDSEPDLLNRMYKAFQKLATCNNQNKPRDIF
jgi:hypothetical protein